MRKVPAVVLAGDAGELAASVGTFSWLSMTNARVAPPPVWPLDEVPETVRVTLPSVIADVSTPMKSTRAGVLAPKPAEGALKVASWVAPFSSLTLPTPSGWDTVTLKVWTPFIGVASAGVTQLTWTTASPLWHLPPVPQWYPVGQLPSEAQEMVLSKFFEHAAASSTAAAAATRRWDIIFPLRTPGRARRRWRRRRRLPPATPRWSCGWNWTARSGCPPRRACGRHSEGRCRCPRP